MKTPLKKRLQQAEYKRSHWQAVKDYQREYMRTWRSREPGKTIIRYANRAYATKNKFAIAMYNQLIRLAEADGLRGRGKCPRKQRGEWKIAA